MQRAPERLSTNREKVDAFLLRHLDETDANPPNGKLTVIVQLSYPCCREELANWRDKLKGMGGRYRRSLPLINGFSASLPFDALAQLVASPEVARISSDREVSHFHT